MKIEVKPEGEKFGLFVNDQLIGTSKNQYDADFAANVLRNAAKPTLVDAILPIYERAARGKGEVGQ